ncbi:MAG TPA: Gfo/Idh/MocA family oxidoreductase [Anaerolineales bacterium]|nr:Gfo/Idh/MocA family oxidoreductase [Anaerolineales bacterium]
MADKILRWGLLSTARINQALIPPLRASKRNRLTAVASRSQTAAQAYARAWKIPRAFGTYEALLDDPEIDVIYNPLPNSLHAEWTVKALRAGKHVLCEKPMVLSLAEMDAIRTASRQTGRVAAEAFMYRHHPQTLKVQEMVAEGSLGTLQLIRGSFTFLLEREGDVRLDKELGGGSIWDVGCYPISYARLVAGADPLEVFGWQVTGPTGIDMSFIGQMRFAGELHAQFDCGFASPFHSFMEIVGTEGTLNIPLPFKPEQKAKIYFTHGRKTDTLEIKGRELYIGEVEDMADVVLLGKPPRMSLDDSRGNAATILALLESARSGKTVAL